MKFEPGAFIEFTVPKGTKITQEFLERIIRQKEGELDPIPKVSREMSLMERLLQDASLLRDAHYNVLHRLQTIREHMIGPIPESGTEAGKIPEGNGAFGILQARLSEMDDLLNDAMNEIIRIEKILGIEIMTDKPPSKPAVYVDVPTPVRNRERQ